MCVVTRVINSCGHVNDHVVMVCRDAKPLSPAGPDLVLSDSTNRDAATSELRYPDRMKLARPISPGFVPRYVLVVPLLSSVRISCCPLVSKDTDLCASYE
jgi:hypothetical protein